MMQPQRRRRKKRTNPLKVLIAVLALILIAVLAVAVSLSLDAPPDPKPTDPEQTLPATDPTPAPTLPNDPGRTGWFQNGGDRYYYQDGTYLTGAAQIDGSIYCFGTDGVMLSGGWQEVSGKLYYLNSDGTAHLGWLEEGNERYYLRTDGTMARGCQEIDGQKYYFTASGCHIFMVNPWNYVPEGYEPTLKDLGSSISTENQRVSEDCYDALVRMMNDCIAAGNKVCVVSSYRTHAYQEYLFERQVQKQMNKGLSREEALVEAAKISAIPGTSEHQLGLAVDIVDYSTGDWDLSSRQEQLPGQQWLIQNSWRYGFILRYPNGTTDETGIIYEPWHYRYVGEEVAADLHASGQTLEGYLASLH